MATQSRRSKTSKRTEQAPTDHGNRGLANRSLAFADHLLGLSKSPVLPKRESTKLRLLAAAAALLETKTIQELRAADIAAGASAAHGTFYIYFENKFEMAKELLALFLQFSEKEMLTVGETEDAFSTIYASTLQFVRLYRENVGLMRCMRHLSDESAEFAQVERKADAAWFGRVARNIARRSRRKASDQDILFLSYALGSMVDDFLYVRYLGVDPNVERLAHTEEEIAEKLSIVWYRALFMQSPVANRLQYGASLAKLSPGE